MVETAAADWLRWVELENRERATIAGYRVFVNKHIVPRLGATKLAALTTPRVQKFRDDLLADLPRPLAKQVLGRLKAILKDAKRRGNVAQNVAADVMIGSTLAWCMMLGMIGDDARNAQAYLARLASRPAFARAQAD